MSRMLSSAEAPIRARTIFARELKLFGGLLIAWLLGFDWFLVDRYRLLPSLPPGVGTVLLECLLEASVIATLWANRATLTKPERYFLWFFCFLLPSDLCFLTLHYWLGIHEENWLTFALTTVPYSAVYVLGSIGFYKHIRPRLANMSWISFVWLPLLLIVPAIFGILLPLLAAHQQAAGWSFDLIEIAFNSVFAVTFFFWSTVALIMSLDILFSFVGLAGIISQLGNWGGVSAYLLHQNTFTFGEYEFLWLCGIVAFWYALVVVRRAEAGAAQPAADEAPAQPASGPPRRSLVIQERMTVIALVSASLICAVLLSNRDIWSYRIVFFGIAIGSFLAILIGELLSKQIVHYATLFGRIVNVTANEEAFPLQEREIPAELWQVYRMAFHEEMVQHRMKAAVRQNLAEQASQVAHDIRSPLVALDSFVREAANLPEDKRIVVRGAVGRIRDIANSLLDKHRNPGSAAPGGEEPSLSCLLSSLIDPLVTEKRLQYRARIGVQLDSRMDDSSYGLFAEVQPVEFKRAISNLVNNAVEAFGDSEGGLVVVSLAAQDGAILVRVQDDGKGIPPELLARLGDRGESHGKPGGSGLGLHHAKTRAEAWGGRIEIASKVGEGTAVTMVLPQAPAPDWFVSELRLDPAAPVVILDDDASIHQVWRGRIDSLLAEGGGPEIVHCSTPSEIRRWVASAPERAAAAVYLIDQELLGYPETGLGLAEELGIGERTILVTSRFEEPAVLNGCRRLGARLIPKILAGLVPIRLGRPETGRWDAVFIDNDHLARLNWKHAAAKAGKKLLIFSSASEFFREAARIDRRTTIYVDQELGAGIKGDQAAARMTELGFTEIYLATGHEAPAQADIRHLKGVVGKVPPWEQERVAS